MKQAVKNHVISWEEEREIMGKVEKLLQRKLKKYQKTGKGEIHRIPCGPDTSKFFSVQSNDYEIQYNQWVDYHYGKWVNHMCILLKVGSANLKLMGGLSELKKVTEEISEKVLKKYNKYKNSDNLYVCENEEGGRLYTKYDYGTSWSYVGLANSQHKFCK